jgi:acyl-CoA dehydrogenase
MSSSNDLTCDSGTVVAEIARSRAEIESARLLVLSAALQVSTFVPCLGAENEWVLKIDKQRAKGALKEIGIAKVWLLDSPLQCMI